VERTRRAKLVQTARLAGIGCVEAGAMARGGGAGDGRESYRVREPGGARADGVRKNRGA